jgi:hypothetical protein
MSVGGPHFGDPIKTGEQAGADFGDGWQQGIEDITPQIEDTTAAALQGLYDDVLVPWQTMTTDYLSGVGFGFGGALATGISSAGGDVAASASRVGGAVGSALSSGLQGSVGGALSAIGSVKSELASLTDKTVTITINTVHTDDGRGGTRFGGGDWQRIAQSYGVGV